MTTTEIDYSVKRGDHGGTISGVMSDNGAPVNLSGATIRFQMRRRFKSDEDPVVDYELIGDWIDLENSHVRYVWQAGDTDEVGLFEAEWEVTYSSGQVQTFPTGRRKFLLIEVQDDV